MPEARPAIHTGDEQRRFAWPPRELGDALPAPTTPAAAPSTRIETTGALRQAARSVEMFWLAPTAIPLRRRIAELAWAPDPFGAYCDRCGLTIGPHEADDFGCADCRGEPIPWTRFIRLGAYDGELAEWIIDLKFRGRRNVANELGGRLAQAAQRAGFPTAQSAIVPVGMAWSRRFMRPYDHAAEIARPVARAFEAPLVHAFRRKRRPSQRSVPASRRRENVRGSFLPRNGVDFTGWTVLLVDDVRTSGATLGEASRTLRRMGAREIWAAVLAVTPGRARRSVGMTPTEADMSDGGVSAGRERSSEKIL